MTKHPRHIIKFMEMQGYIYDQTADAFKKQDEPSLDFLKGMFDIKGAPDAR